MSALGARIANLEQALADAEHRARVAEDDLAYLARDTGGVLHGAHQRLDALARELAQANAERERSEAALAALRGECERVHGRLPALEQAARAVLELAERRRGELAEQRRVHELVAARLVAEREGVALLAERLASERAAATARRAAEDRASAGRRAALETVHRMAEASETELRLRADLEFATRETLALRTRLGACEQALQESDRALERERGIADEATRWASRVERELVPDPSPVASGAEVEPAQSAAAGPPISPLRRRGPRVRLRPVS